MCDKNNWMDYVAGSANYAVGGPTLELLVKAARNTKSTKPKSIMDEITEVNQYGYPNNISGIQQSWDTKLFNNGKSYKIASPSSITFSWAAGYMLILSDGSVNLNEFSEKSDGVRPLVSIPTSKLKWNGKKLVILP